MTQQEISALIEPIRKNYNEVYAKLHTIKSENYPSGQLCERHRENLLGQTTAYQDVLSILQSVHMKIAIQEVEKVLGK